MSTAEQPLAAVTEPVAAPAAAPESTPAPTPSAEPSSHPQTSDVDNILRKAVTSALPVDDKGQITQPKKDAVASVVPPVVPPAAKTPEEIEAEKQAALATETPEQKTEREKAEAEAEAKETPKEPDPLDKVGALPAEKLAEAIKNTPELEAALAKAGIDKEVLFQTARDAALASQFTELFPTVEAAQFANENANHFYNIEESFPAIQTVEDLDKFIMDVMLPLSIIPGADGKPQMMEDGKTFKTDGSVSRFLKLGTDYDMGMSGNIADQILAAANQLPDSEGKTAQKEYAESLKAAVDFIQEFRNNGYRMPTAKSRTSELPPDVKARLENAERIERESRDRETQTQKQQEDLFDKTVEDDTVKFGEGLISELLNATNLNDKAKESAAKEIYAELAKELPGDKTFKRMAAQYRAQGLNDTTKQKLVALNKNTIKGKYAKIVERVVGERGGQVISAAAARQNKIATQIDTDRLNPGTTSSAPAKGPSPLTDDQISKQAYENAKAANGGNEPDLSAVFSERLKLLGKRIA